MTTIVFLDRGTIGPNVQLTQPSFDHDWVCYEQTDAAQVVHRALDAGVIITNKVPLRRDTLRQLPKLKLIAIAATGYDVVDLETCRQLGITVTNVRGYAKTTVPEHVMMLMLALSRSVIGYRQDVIQGEWQKAGQFCFFNHPIKDLRGAKLGIIGTGTLGREVAKLAQAFGMIPLFASRKGQPPKDDTYVPFNEVLAQADVITLHTPLTPDTRDLITLTEFRQMQRKPLIINTGRGGLVNEADLVTALDEGLISGAGVDVLTSEPPEEDHPLIEIAERPNVIITPHVAWASDEAMQNLWYQVIESIESFRQGQTLRAL